MKPLKPQNDSASIRVARPTPAQRVLIRALSPQERLAALLIAARAKLRAATDDDAARSDGEDSEEDRP